MRQIYIANPKGGCGKTTLSIHLATYFASQGLSVALCDHDQQRSSIDWVKARPDYLPGITGIEFFRHKIVTNRFDIAIHDMPANCSVEDLIGSLNGNQLIIPVLPSPTDIRACVRFLMALNRANLVEENPNRIGLVANRVNNRTSYSKVLSAFLNQVNLPVVGYLRDTQNYVRSIDAGVGIFDFPKKALQQDVQQWQSIIEWLEGSRLVTTKPIVQKNAKSRSKAKSKQPSKAIPPKRNRPAESSIATRPTNQTESLEPRVVH